MLELVGMKPQNTDAQPDAKKSGSSRRRNLIKTLVIVVAAAILSAGSYVGYIYAVSPEHIRNPKFEHYHFRMQILVDGKAENFAEQKYQTGYAKDQCNANLPEQPVHFHDNKDQFTHIHWEGMTGGIALKYYGWNYIGGLGDALGYKLDDLSNIQKVTTHGSYLPQVPKDQKFYVYVGDEKAYQEKSFDDFVNKDLEEFFGKESNLPIHQENKTSFIDSLLFKRTSAHGTEDHSTPADQTPLPTTAPEEGDQEKLTRINNLIGNVVIFAQKDKPTDEQIKERFNKLEPLSESTCGG